jgi:hypothetical protein
MKKILIIFVALMLSSCGMLKDTSSSPFKSYKSIEPETTQMIEKGILSKESEKEGLDLSSSSAHVVEFTRIDQYAKGKVRILGNYTSAEMEKRKIKNGITNYTVTFEYSYTTGYYIWNRTFD